VCVLPIPPAMQICSCSPNQDFTVLQKADCIGDYQQGVLSLPSTFLYPIRRSQA